MSSCQRSPVKGLYGKIGAASGGGINGGATRARHAGPVARRGRGALYDLPRCRERRDWISTATIRLPSRSAPSAPTVKNPPKRVFLSLLHDCQTPQGDRLAAGGFFTTQFLIVPIKKRPATRNRRGTAQAISGDSGRLYTQVSLRSPRFTVRCVDRIQLLYQCS